MKTYERVSAIDPWTWWSNRGDGWDTAARPTEHGFLVIDLVDMGDGEQVVQFAAIVNGRKHEMRQERTPSESLTRVGAVRVGLRWLRGLVTDE